MLRIWIAATIGGAALLPFLVPSRLANAEDSAAIGLFQDAGETFLESSIATSGMAPAFAIALLEVGETEDPEVLTTEERIRILEESLKKLDSSWTRFDEGTIRKQAEAARKPTFEIGGRIQMDFWDFIDQTPGIGYFENPSGAQAGQPPEDRFLFRRIRLECQGDIPDNMLWRLQIDFQNPSFPRMKDVFFGFRELPGNQTLVLGNQKIPLGLDALNSSRFNVFIERPLVNDAFDADYRRPGICMYGESDDESINWRYGTFYLADVSFDGRYIGDSRQMSINGRLAGSPWYDDSTDCLGYFHWGFSGMVAKPDGVASSQDTNTNEARFSTRPEAQSQSRWYDTGAIAGAEWFETIGVETMLNVGPTQIVGEYETTFVQRNGFDDTQFQGAYAYVSYFLTGESIPYDRKLGILGRVQPYENFFMTDRHGGSHAAGWGAWNVAARYSYLDLTDKDIRGGIGHAGTLALNWHWNAHAKLQFDLTYGQISDHEAVGGYTGGDYTFCGTRFAVDF